MVLPTVLITGCTKGGIGYSLAKQFAANNYHVFATSRRIETMADLSQIPNVTLLSLDVTSRESVLAAHSQISAVAGGKLDILYHNAGYRSLAMAVEASTEEAFKMFNTNLFGVILLNNVFADMVIRAKGKICFTGSVSGVTPHPTNSVYVASKAAIEIYAKTLRVEVQPFGVRVVFVQTAAVRTGMSTERLKLSDTSKYKYLEPRMNKAWESFESGAMDPDAYAKTVIAKIVKANPPKEIWCGTGATTVWMIERLGISWAYDLIFSRMYGLNKMSPEFKNNI